MSEKETKVRFFAPDNLENHLSEGKEEKKERGGGREEKRKKKIGGHLGDGGVFGQKISCLTEEVDLAVTFSKIRLEIKRNFVITSNK